MTKKKTPTRKARTVRTSAPVQITDPHLTALLSFLDGARGEDPDGRTVGVYGRALAAADRLLTSLPITSAFELHIDPVVGVERR